MKMVNFLKRKLVPMRYRLAMLVLGRLPLAANMRFKYCKDSVVRIKNVDAAFMKCEFDGKSRLGETAKYAYSIDDCAFECVYDTEILEVKDE